MLKFTKYLEQQLLLMHHSLGELVHDVHYRREKYIEAYGEEVTERYLKFLRLCKQHLEDSHYRKLADLVAKEEPTLEVPEKLLHFVNFLRQD